MALPALPDEIEFGYYDRRQEQILPQHAHNLSDADLAKVETIVKGHAKASADAMSSAMAKAIEHASKRSQNWGATVGMTLAILAIYSAGLLWVFDKNQVTQERRLISYETAQEKRLTAYEDLMVTIAGDLESLRQEQIDQIKIVSNQFDRMNQTLLQNISHPMHDHHKLGDDLENVKTPQPVSDAQR